MRIRGKIHRVVANVDDEAEPPWVRDGARIWFGELRLFAVTAARFAKHPRRFGAEWAAGQLRAMNPLGFLAASWPIVLPIDYGLQRLLGWDRRPNLPWTVEVARALKPYLIVIPLALLLFAIFRLAGSSRRLTTTLGIVLYWTAFSAVGWTLGVAACLVAHQGDWLPFLTAFATVFWGVLAMAGAHRIPWSWCLIIFVPSVWISIRSVGALLGWLGGS